MRTSIRWRRCAAALVAATALAGCSVATAGQPVSGGSNSTGGPNTDSNHGIPQGFPTTIPALAKKVGQALQSTTSVHLVLAINAAGLNISGEGDQTVVEGKTGNSSLIMSIPQFGTIRLVTASGKTYVMLPAAQRTSDKPWALVSPKSSNPFVQSFSQSMGVYGPAFSGPESARAFLAAAAHIDAEGSEALSDGTQVVRYRLNVVTSRLPDSLPSKKTLERIKNLPTELAVDGSGNVRQLVESITLHAAGQTISVQVRVEEGDYNAPVSISAPPPDQVATN